MFRCAKLLSRCQLPATGRTTKVDAMAGGLNSLICRVSQLFGRCQPGNVAVYAHTFRRIDEDRTMTKLTYQDPFPLAADTTSYRLLTSDHVSVAQFDGEEVLKIDPEALTVLAREAMRDAAFLLRPAHLEQVAAILEDPEASENDRGVALAMLKNAEVAAKFVLPFCQDTRTAVILAQDHIGR